MLVARTERHSKRNYGEQMGGPYRLRFQEESDERVVVTNMAENLRREGPMGVALCETEGSSGRKAKLRRRDRGSLEKII